MKQLSFFGLPFEIVNILNRGQVKNNDRMVNRKANQPYNHHVEPTFQLKKVYVDSVLFQQKQNEFASSTRNFESSWTKLFSLEGFAIHMQTRRVQMHKQGPGSSLGNFHRYIKSVWHRWKGRGRRDG